MEAFVSLEVCLFLKCVQKEWCRTRGIDGRVGIEDDLGNHPSVRAEFFCRPNTAEQ